MSDTFGADESLTERDARLDALFEALADTHRRQVVRYFQATEDDVASVSDLVDYAADDAQRALTRDRLQVAFPHVTLPKLSELQVIEYDARSRTVRYRNSPALERVLTVAEDELAAV